MEDQTVEPREALILRDVEGTFRKSGVDQFGNRWIEFDGDMLALEEHGACALCGKQIDEGWMSLESGYQACSKHVETR